MQELLLIFLELTIFSKNFVSGIGQGIKNSRTFSGQVPPGQAPSLFGKLKNLIKPNQSFRDTTATIKRSGERIPSSGSYSLLGIAFSLIGTVQESCDKHSSCRCNLEVLYELIIPVADTLIVTPATIFAPK